AAREAAALVEKDWYGIVRLTGSERVSWLQGMVTNDVEKLRPGQGCYAAHLTPQGKIVAHMLILANEDSLWLVLERANIPRLVAAFDKLLSMEDVQVIDESERLTILGIIGPKAGAGGDCWLDESPQLTGMYARRTREWRR